MIVLENFIQTPKLLSRAQPKGLPC